MGKTISESDCRRDQPVQQDRTPWRARVTHMRWEANNALALYHELWDRANRIELEELAIEKEYGR